jgi:phosphomannomutase
MMTIRNIVTRQSLDLPRTIQEVPCPRGFVILQPTIQHYSWGDSEFIPRILNRSNLEGRPFAELWMGAHPEAPSRVQFSGNSITLSQLIAQSPEEILHPANATRFQGQLPYLFKVLAAAQPLSLQLHPSQGRAEAGYARENRAEVPLNAPNRNYKDPHHKPELIAALTDFYGLRGFRPLPDIAQQLAIVPELRALGSDFTPDLDSLRNLYLKLMNLPQSSVDEILSRLVGRLSAEHGHRPFQKSDREYWLLRSDQVYSTVAHRDRGLFSFYLLNLVRLEPGQAMYLPPGVLHAYLEGAGMEVMANSNNVLRGGLTSKHIDVPELLENVSFEAGEPEVIVARQAGGGGEWIYPTPTEEFELRRLEVTENSPHTNGPEHCADILIVLSLAPAAKVVIDVPGSSHECGQGQVFLVPQGIPYGIRASAPATLYKATVPMRTSALVVSDGQTEPLSFRGRQPRPLAFGTSGLRGLVTDITDLEAYVNTRGFLDYLCQIGDVKPGTLVCVAGDLRPSTDGSDRSLLRAVARAIEDAGLIVDNLGKLPTPALTYYALENGHPSIMVTGSHIPFDRNGIKFNLRSGEVLKSHEPAILRAVQQARREVYGQSPATSPFRDDGMFKEGQARPLPPVNSQACQAYLRRYEEFFPDRVLQGKRIVFYQHSAVGRDLLVDLLARLGAEVIALGRSETFLPIDTEAITDEQLKTLQALADQAHREHGPIDAVVSTDGDSDRPLMAGVDASGQIQFYGGDRLGLVVAGFVQADAVVVPISANDAVDLWSAARGVMGIKTRIGSPYVIEGMERARARGARRVVGWEANGGFLIGADLHRQGRVLKALPTRDAALPLLATLALAQELDVSVATLFAQLPRRFSKSGLIDGFSLETSRSLIRQFSLDEHNLAQIDFEDENVRLTYEDGRSASATGLTTERARRIRNELEQHFLPADGFDQVASINLIDGLRIFFRNGEISHIRPSGNAPQLRFYSVASDQARADAMVASAIAEPNGILRRLETFTKRNTEFVTLTQRIRKNITLTQSLLANGETPEIIGTVSGSQHAQVFWQGILDQTRVSFKARAAISFHEDLPTNQAFGLLLLWQRLKEHRCDNRGALVAFVFGDGTRSTPFTETDNAQKPAIATFVPAGPQRSARFLSMVELAMRCFVPVQQYLRRSGFDGLVIKWGDEVQIPALDLSGTDPLFRDADVVRFVSVREIDADGAQNKDWVGVNAGGNITAFIARRPLAKMQDLASQGFVERRDGRLYGGVNLGSIGVSYALLDCLWEEFKREVNDASASRQDRPALDPEFFTALTIAAMEMPSARAEAWARARLESPDVERLHRHFPGVLDRLRRAIESLEQRQMRKLKMVALDFEDQYWGDIGQHAKIYEFYMALNHPGPAGDIARSIANLPGNRDENGNLLVNAELGLAVNVHNSVVINATISGAGLVENSVLIGTRAKRIHARDAFDVLSTVTDLTLDPRSGAYKVVAAAAVHVHPGQRLTTLFLPALGPQHFVVNEDTDLRDKTRTYAVPILGNPLSFQQAHQEMGRLSVNALDQLRKAEESKVLAGMDTTG